MNFPKINKRKGNMAHNSNRENEVNVEFLVNFFNEDVYAVAENPLAAQESANSAPPKKTSQNNIAAPVKEEIAEENQALNLLKHKVCVLTFYPGKQNIIAKDKLFLETVLKAVNVYLAQTDIINIAARPEFNYDLLKNAATEKLLAFGLPKELVPKNAKPYHVEGISGAKAIFAAPLSEIISNVPQKKQLWKALQQMFNV